MGLRAKPTSISSSTALKSARIFPIPTQDQQQQQQHQQQQQLLPLREEAHQEQHDQQQRQQHIEKEVQSKTNSKIVILDVKTLPANESIKKVLNQINQQNPCNTKSPLTTTSSSSIAIETNAKLIVSNASVQSNMAPALTEPSSPANKLSSTTTSALPRSTSTLKHHYNGINIETEGKISSKTSSLPISTPSRSNFVNGDFIDFDTELLKVASEKKYNNKEENRENTIKNNIISLNSFNNNNSKNHNISHQKGNTALAKVAFQQAFEQVIAKQKAATEETIESRNSFLNRIYNTEITDKIKPAQISTATIEKFSRGRRSRQMGPMCDTNNLTKSQLLETSVTATSTTLTAEATTTTTTTTATSSSSSSVLFRDDGQQTIQSFTSTSSNADNNEENTKKTTNAKLSNVEVTKRNEQKSQEIYQFKPEEEAQTEIHSSSSTVTAENTDVEDNFQEVESVIAVQQVCQRLQKSSPVSLSSPSSSSNIASITSNVNIISGSSQTNVEYNQQSTQFQQQQQSQQFNNQIQTIPICSLTPQSTSSGGGVSSSQRDFIKDSAEMDQVLNDMDLLQVLKGFDSTPGGDNLCDLAGNLGLFNDVDVMTYEEIGGILSQKDSETRELIHGEIRKTQQQLQRKCDYLLRKLRKVQANYMARHCSEEFAGLLEWTNRRSRQNSNRQILYEEDKRRPVSITSMKLFLRRLAAVATSQHCSKGKSNRNKLSNVITTPSVSAPPPQTTTTKRSSLLPSAISVATPSTSTVKSSGNANKGGMPSQIDTLPIVTTYDEKTTQDIEYISGMLQTEMKEVQSGIDSDATASSSGGESADEMVTYNNQLQQPLPIRKRASWRYARHRAAIAARYTWITAQKSDMDYRIRQHEELQKQIRKNKGAVTFEKYPTTSTTTTITSLTLSPSSSTLSTTGAAAVVTSVVSPSSFDIHQQQQQPSSVNGYRGTLIGATTSSSSPSSSSSLVSTSKAFDIDASNSSGSPLNGTYESLPGTSRTRPFHGTNFRKRKLLQTVNVHTVSKKAARPSTIKCGCQWPLHPCALCTGRTDPTAPRDLPDTMKFSERVALLDSGFHPVLSFPEDIGSNIHFEGILRLSDWQDRVMRTGSKQYLKNASNNMSTLSSAQKSSSSGGHEHYSAASNSKKNADGRRKYNRKHGQDSGPANKIKKARRALHGNQQQQQPQQDRFNNIHPHHLNKNNNSNIINNNSSSGKHRKISSTATGGGVGGSTTATAAAAAEYQDANLGVPGGSSDGSGGGGSDTCDFGSIPRSKTSSPTPANHHTHHHHHHHHYNYNKNESKFDRKNRNPYDIDNIVIPYSVAAATRVEILPYKEIPTPKWRIIEDDEVIFTTEIKCEKIDTIEEQDKLLIPPSATSLTMTTTTVKTATTSCDVGDEEEIEDISDLAVQIRHERALAEERKKFQTYLKFPWSTRSRANRRYDSRAESSGANTPDPTSPASNTPNTAGDQESIPSPANPATPQTPAETVEGSDNNNQLIKDPIAAYLNSSVNRKNERRRTVSSKKDSIKDERRSSSPDGRDIIPPYEPLEFPLSDEKYQSMLAMMPNQHNLLLLKDCTSIKSDCDQMKTTSKMEDDPSEGNRRNSILTEPTTIKTNDTLIKKSLTTICSSSSSSSSSKIMSNLNSVTFDGDDSLMGCCDSDTESAESGLQEEDPNDPEWREPA